jgi:hypothetical protein
MHGIAIQKKKSMHGISKGNFYIGQLFQSKVLFFCFCFSFPQGLFISTLEIVCLHRRFSINHLVLSANYHQQNKQLSVKTAI